MEWLRDLFITNRVVVFAVYGQVFFTLGVALAVQSLKHTRMHLGRQLRWLAGFGITHGLVEWGHVFIPIQATYLPGPAVATMEWLQLLLLVFSFACLYQFGLRTAMKGSPYAEPRWVWTSLIALIAVAVPLGLFAEASADDARVATEVWSRYLLAVPGAFAGWQGVMLAARETRAMQLPDIAHGLAISAWSLLGYGLLNLVTPEHHALLAQWLNYDTVLSWLGVPAQVLRTLVGAGMLYGMVRCLPLFDVEMDRMLMDAQRQKLLEAERELALTNQIAITLSQARNPRLVMYAVLEQCVKFLRCDQGEMAVCDEDTATWRLEARVQPPGSLTHGNEPDFSTLIHEVAQTNRLIVQQVTPSLWGVGIPIRSGQRLVAAAAVYRERAIALSPQEAEVVQSLGTLVGVALENGRLWTEVQRKEAARTEWISRIISAQEDERRRVAHEVHDEVIQEVIVICRHLDAVGEAEGPLPGPLAAEVEKARNHAERLIEQLRNFARSLRPPALDLGVAAAVRRLLVDTGDRTGIHCTLQVSGNPKGLHRDMELGLFRIAQEAMRNVIRHAQARRVQVKLTFGTDRITLRIADNGIGLAAGDLDRDRAAEGRLGVLGMRERAALLGGHLEITAVPGRGTTVVAEVPRPPLTAAGAPKHRTDSL